MAKRNPKSDASPGDELKTDQATESATADDRKLAGVAIRAVTGCGMPESTRRLEQLSAAAIRHIAAAERSGDRSSIARRIQLGK